MLSSERAFDDFLDGLNPFWAQMSWEKFERDYGQIRRDEYDQETAELLDQIRTIDPQRRFILSPQETVDAIWRQRVEEIPFREHKHQTKKAS